MFIKLTEKDQIEAALREANKIGSFVPTIRELGKRNMIHEGAKVRSVASSLEETVFNLDSGYAVILSEISFVEVLQQSRMPNPVSGSNDDSGAAETISAEQTDETAILEQAEASAKPRKRGHHRERSQTLSLFPNMQKPVYADQLRQLGYCTELGMSYYEATLKKYREHVTACVKAGSRGLIEEFEMFAKQIVDAAKSTPSDRPDQATQLRVRLAILKDDELDEPLPAVDFRQVYHQYTPPSAQAMI
jgi:hypothetical protein